MAFCPSSSSSSSLLQTICGHWETLTWLLRCSLRASWRSLSVCLPFKGLMSPLKHAAAFPSVWR